MNYNGDGVCHRHEMIYCGYSSLTDINARDGVADVLSVVRAHQHISEGAGARKNQVASIAYRAHVIHGAQTPFGEYMVTTQDITIR